MRIAILTNAFPPDGRGGAEKIAYMQADGFGVLGHEVRVWAPGRPGDATTGQTVHGIYVERFASEFGRLPEISVTRRLAYHLLGDKKPRRDVARKIIEWKPDALLTHNLTGCGLGTARLVQSHGVRWIHTLHDIQLTDPSGQETVAFAGTIRARVWRAFWSAWRRGAFGEPNAVISPTQWLLDWHGRHGWFGGFGGRGAPRAPRNAEARSSGRTQSARTGITIPNPVSSSAPRDRSLRHPATVAYVGRLSRDKGFDVFLDVLKRLDASVVSRAIVVGDGPMMKRARGLSDPRLELRGVLPPEDARQVIAEADLLIAPSRILENQQTILLEAMTEGTPVAASDTGGTQETLDGTGCPVVATGTDMAEEFETAARQLLGDADEWLRASRAMQERAKRHDQERYFSSLFGLLSG